MDINGIENTVGVMLSLSILILGIFHKKISLISVGIGSLLAVFLYIVYGFNLFVVVLIGVVVSLLIFLAFAYFVEK